METPQQEQYQQRPLSPKSLNFWTRLRYRIGASLVAWGLRIFLKENIVPKKFRILDDKTRSLGLSYLFATNVLNRDVEALSPELIEFLSFQPHVPMNLSHPLFIMYVHLNKCLDVTYGDQVHLESLNNSIFSHGIERIFDEIARGNAPVMNYLPPKDAMVMRAIKDAVARLQQQQEAKEKEEAEKTKSPESNKKKGPKSDAIN